MSTAEPYDAAPASSLVPDGREETPGDPTLAVVVKGYPRLSETFIAQEFEALEARGFRFDIWSLRAPYDAFEHPVHGRIAARRCYLPEYLHREPLRVLRGLWRARRLPGAPRALAAFLGDLTRDPTPNRIRRFGQAAVLAAELPGATRFLYVHFLHTPGSVARYAEMMRGLGWGLSAHAKDIWTTPEREIADKLADADFAVTCTAAGAEHLDSLTTDPSRVHLAYHGLAAAEMPAPPDRPPRAPAGPVTLVSVGRVVEKKGYDDLIAALSSLPADLDWRLVHIGGGALSAAMKQRAAAAGIAGRIDWRGKQPRDRVVAALAAADLFVLPSKVAGDGDRDGLPNVIMEAASQALPILATRAGAIAEFVRDGREGLLVPPGDPAALAEAIARLLADPVLCQQLGQAALERLDTGFRPEPGMALIERLLRIGLGDAAPAEREPAPRRQTA
ncbi:MAG: glycosyltransferase family 4 protein [Pseudomonadota bacterium]